MECPYREQGVSFYGLVRRDGKTLFVAIPRDVVEKHDIRAGDVVKVTVVRVVRRER